MRLKASGFTGWRWRFHRSCHSRNARSVRLAARRSSGCCPSNMHDRRLAVAHRVPARRVRGGIRDSASAQARRCAVPGFVESCDAALRTELSQVVKRKVAALNRLAAPVVSRQEQALADSYRTSHRWPVERPVQARDPWSPWVPTDTRSPPRRGRHLTIRSSCRGGRPPQPRPELRPGRPATQLKR